MWSQEGSFFGQWQYSLSVAPQPLTTWFKVHLEMAMMDIAFSPCSFHVTAVYVVGGRIFSVSKKPKLKICSWPYSCSRCVRPPGVIDWFLQQLIGFWLQTPSRGGGGENGPPGIEGPGIFLGQWPIFIDACTHFCRTRLKKFKLVRENALCCVQCSTTCKL